MDCKNCGAWFVEDSEYLRWMEKGCEFCSEDCQYEYEFVEMYGEEEYLLACKDYEEDEKQFRMEYSNG